MNVGYLYVEKDGKMEYIGKLRSRVSLEMVCPYCNSRYFEKLDKRRYKCYLCDKEIEPQDMKYNEIDSTIRSL